MYISINWLRDYLNLPTNFNPNELAARLTMSTVEVEDVIFQAKNLDNVVIGEIKEIIKHPKADNLSICHMDVGKEKYLQIVCGGKNIRPDMKVAVSLIGSQVFWHGQKTLQKIEKTKIRGIESEGMICSSAELGLENYFSGDGIMDMSDYAVKNGVLLSKVLNLDDAILEIDNKSLTNRPDLWGHYGMAREISALYGLKLKSLPLSDFKTSDKNELKIEIENSNDCPCYCGLIMNNIKVAESPLWLKNKLLAAGQKPINNIVDLTNYVMFELGQPLHAFDFRAIQDGRIIVKKAVGGKFMTLDGKERELSDEILTINDSKGIVALAGIMGGVNSGISNDTVSIIIESANFNPNLIRKASVILNLRSEASTRFEKGLDPVLAKTAIKRIVQLILNNIPGSEVSSKLIETGNYQQFEKIIEVELNFLQKRLGEKISLKKVVEILESLFFTVKTKKNTLFVGIPSFRATKDITIPEDLVEEIGRIYGYNKIKEDYPLVPLIVPEFNWELKQEKLIKNFLAQSLSYDEVVNYAFVSSQDVDKMKLKANDFFHLLNQISVEQSLLRTNLAIGLIKSAELNLKYFDHFRIFELGRVFKKKAGDDWRDPDKKYSLPQQEKHLAGLVVGEKDSFLAAKGTVNDILEKFNVNYELKADENYHPWIDPRRALKIIVNDQIIGSIGKIHQSVKEAYDIETAVAFFGLNFSKLTKIISGEKKFKPLLKFPEVIKDLSIIIDHDVLWGDIEKEIVSSSGLITKVELFDVYQSDTLGNNKKSLAFHLTFYHQERTLISNEVDQEIKKIIANLETKFQAMVRKS